MRKKIKLLSIALCAVLVMGAVTMKAEASFSRQYAIAQNTESNGHGSYFYATIKPLDANWSSTNSSRFILHTTWVGSGDKWIENGFMDGAMAGPGGNTEYHHGFYTATGSHDNSIGYSEYKIIGPSTNDGTSHSFQIQRDGTNSWGVYVDYTLRRTYTNFATSCDSIDVGLETNESTATSAQWNERAIQRLTTSRWKDWGSGELSVGSNNVNASWGTKYSSIYTSKTTAKSAYNEYSDTETMSADSMPLITNPEPVLEGNSELLTELQRGRSNTIDMFNLENNGGEIVTDEYMTYSDYLNFDDGATVSTEIAADRVVFVAQVYYPDGYEHFRAGFIDHCLATGIYDAVTGEYLGGNFKSVN